MCFSGYLGHGLSLLIIAFLSNPAHAEPSATPSPLLVRGGAASSAVLVRVDQATGGVEWRIEQEEMGWVDIGWSVNLARGSLVKGGALRFVAATQDSEGQEVTLVFLAEEPTVSCIVRVQGSQIGVTIDVDVDNLDTMPLRINGVDVWAFKSDPLPGSGGQKVYVDSPTWSGVKSLGKQPVVSNLETVLYRRTPERALLVGFLSYESGDNWIELRPGSGPLGGAYMAAQSKKLGLLMPGATWTSDRLLVSVGSDPIALLETYGQEVNKTTAPVLPENPVAGFSTWYGFRTEINEDLILRVADWCSEFLGGYPQPMDLVFLVDHGWTKNAELGEWDQPDPARFPGGMAELSGHLGELGMELGLWCTPTCVTSGITSFSSMKRYLVGASQGRPLSLKADIWQGGSREAFVLDASTEEARKWWERNLEAMNTWGVSFWKFDFLRVHASRSRQKNFPISELHQSVWKSFWSSIDANDRVMPCSAFANRHLGNCNVMNIPADVGDAGRWPDDLGDFRRIFSTISASWFKHRNFWINDHQSVQVGGGSRIGEARVRATMVAFSGAGFWVGEPPWLLPPERVEILRRCLPVYGLASVPVNLFAGDDVPNIWSLPLPPLDGRETNAVAVFNLAESTLVAVVEPGHMGLGNSEHYSAWEWWTGQDLGFHRGPLEIEVPPMDVCVIHVAPERLRPGILSTDFHYAPGFILEEVQWREGRSELSGVIRTKTGLRGSLFGTLPPGYRIVEGSGQVTQEEASRLWRIDLTTTGGSTPFRIKFAGP